MFKNSRVVPLDHSHTYGKGDDMNTKTKKYDASYKFGNTTVHVVAPPPISDEQKEIILEEFHRAGWAIWNSLSIEEQLKLNEEAEAEKA
ncbi:hypothetical protein SAMN00017405_0422 [Desulfonispora thiosulfatigenes DSM 11270]|uniref:Uncharacterized protein n=1 Tax=Desulfonispora thiosulfatigenes DSM 11270 TaxID=656914 RepID=A0A1W1VQ99_DESTI|nr:hypothetical protein [Desulfonispora thiosulfatigenes]SMB95527.1 hypothetical protein SAMN00017405_0422 [Desulfonispora thiosulfatigenes DSM 11270]